MRVQYVCVMVLISRVIFVHCNLGWQCVYKASNCYKRRAFQIYIIYFSMYKFEYQTYKFEIFTKFDKEKIIVNH